MNDTGTPVYARQHSNGLTLPQQSAVDLLASGKTDTETAELLNLHRTTVTKWRLYSTEFQAALHQRRAEVWGSGIDKLRALIPQALNVLADTMADSKHPDRIKSAVAVLKLVQFHPVWLKVSPNDVDETVRQPQEPPDACGNSFGELEARLRSMSDDELLDVSRKQFDKLNIDDEDDSDVETDEA